MMANVFAYMAYVIIFAGLPTNVIRRFLFPDRADRTEQEQP